MRLKSLSYAEYEGEPLEWRLDELTLGPTNLIVGKNAAGKTRTLNVISALAQMLISATKPGHSSDYDAVFDHEGQVFRYELKIGEMKVLREKLTVDRTVRLDRGAEGIGHIFAEKIGAGKKVRFQTPQDELAASARRDAIQHSFLQPLYEWASSLKHYYFGTDLGKSQLAVLQGKNRPGIAENETNAVQGLFSKGENSFGKRFIKAIIKDMGMLGYPIEDIGLAAPVSFRIVAGPAADLVCLFVKEKALHGVTDQHAMSQGMFRALAILIYMNYAQFSNKLASVLIDDIGEGLDFDRSIRLIDLLRKKSQSSAIQLIVATNDRFVMNKIHLEEWSLLQRSGSHVSVFNYANSRKHFDQFKFMGLNNFDFLQYDFINEDPDTIFATANGEAEAE